jgi:hypothetical protein
MEDEMKKLGIAFAIAALAAAFTAVETAEAQGPADRLPPHIKRITWFGERADFSLDGKRILFIEKTFGDVYEVEIATGVIRPATHHFRHQGFTRALYLSNGDILLSGPEVFNPKNPNESRTLCRLSVLDRSLTKPPAPLGTMCSEGPAVSRKRLHIAWTHVAEQYPADMPPGTSRMMEADLLYENGTPKLANQRLILDSRDLPFKCTLETQNFRPPDESELTFSAYGHQGTDVCGIDLRTKKVTNYSDAPGQYDEPEGIYPDGRHTLVECDKHTLKGSGFSDVWKLALDGSRAYERVTFFSDVPGWRGSNPVVSDDGRFIAFQLANSTDPAGVGYGIFLFDIGKAAKSI